MASADLYDVIVVGAGLTGALVASTLAEEGLQVVVLEATQALGGTVRRQPSLALLGTPEPFAELQRQQGEAFAQTLWKLTSENLTRLEDLLEQVGLEARRTGSLRLASNGTQAQVFRESAAQLADQGYAVSIEDDNQDEDLVALSTSDDLIFEPGALARELLAHENIIVTLDAEVQALKRRASGAIGVWAHRRYLWSDKVILANGIHATRLRPELATRLHPICVHTLLFENSQTLARSLVMDDGHICFLPYDDQAQLVGWDDNEMDILWRLSAVADQLCPGAQVHERFTTWATRSNDRLPVVGQLADDPDIYIVNGLGPFGLNLSVIATDALVDLVLYDHSSEIFALERFDQDVR